MNMQVALYYYSVILILLRVSLAQSVDSGLCGRVKFESKIVGYH